MRRLHAGRSVRVWYRLINRMHTGFAFAVWVSDSVPKSDQRSEMTATYMRICPTEHELNLHCSWSKSAKQRWLLGRSREELSSLSSADCQVGQSTLQHLEPSPTRSWETTCQLPSVAVVVETLGTCPWPPAHLHQLPPANLVAAYLLVVCSKESIWLCQRCAGRPLYSHP